MVTLPPTELLDNAHIKTPCTKVQFAAGKVPGENAHRARSSASPKPKPRCSKSPSKAPSTSAPRLRHKLPDIVAALNGQIDIALVGHVDSVNGRLRTTFETVPDAPVSNFTLDLYGGRKGLTENSEDLCSRPQIAAVTLDAQNGKSIAANQRIQLPCSPKHHKRKPTWRPSSAQPEERGADEGQAQHRLPHSRQPPAQPGVGER